MTCAPSCARRQAPRGTPASLPIEVSGCAALSDARACAVGADGVVRVLAFATTEASFESDAGAVVVEPLASFDDGRLYRVHVPRDAHAVRVSSGATDAG